MGVLVKAIISKLLPVVITYIENHKEEMLDYLIDKAEDYAAEEGKEWLEKVCEILRELIGVEDND